VSRHLARADALALTEGGASAPVTSGR